MSVLQEELLDPLILGGFFMHPEHGFSIAREYVMVKVINYFLNDIIQTISKKLFLARHYENILCEY